MACVTVEGLLGSRGDGDGSVVSCDGEMKRKGCAAES